MATRKGILKAFTVYVGGSAGSGMAVAKWKRVWESMRLMRWNASIIPRQQVRFGHEDGAGGDYVGVLLGEWRTGPEGGRAAERCRLLRLSVCAHVYIEMSRVSAVRKYAYCRSAHLSADIARVLWKP